MEALGQADVVATEQRAPWLETISAVSIGMPCLSRFVSYETIHNPLIRCPAEAQKCGVQEANDLAQHEQDGACRSLLRTAATVSATV